MATTVRILCISLALLFCRVAFASAGKLLTLHTLTVWVNFSFGAGDIVREIPESGTHDTGEGLLNCANSPPRSVNKNSYDYIRSKKCKLFNLF
jgi:hypothetical protein